MRYPKFLKNNGTIGFVAPSFGCATEPYLSAFKNAQKKWQAMGYSFDIGKNCYLEQGIGISNTPYECGKELTESYSSKNNDILISCGGGELMCETLEYIDFEKISMSEPKWYMGYSDNTNFIFLSATICDTAAIYAPCASAFGMEPWHSSLNDTMALLTGKSLSFMGYDRWEIESLKSEENPLVPYNATEKSIIHKFEAGQTEETDKDIALKGRLLGGCMDCLINLIGTKYDKVAEFNKKYKNDGILWFLEACDLNVMSIRRGMWQMKNTGWFDNCSGFIIGRPRIFNEPMMGLDQYRAVVDIISEFNVPILMDADIGHLPPMIPLVCGAKAEVKTVGNEYFVNMELN